jgi:YbbR-like protein
MSDETPSPVMRMVAAVTANASLKLVSLAIAIALYALLHHGAEAQRTVDVDLIATPPRDGTHVLLTPLPPRVLVTVQGSRTLLDDLPSTIEPLAVDLASEPTTLRLEQLPFKLPPGVRRIHVVPPVLTLRWDVRTSKRVRVEPVYSAPPEGLALRDLTVTPSFVQVSGPKTLLDPVQQLRTSTLELAHRGAGAHVQTLSVGPAAEPNLSGLSFDAEQVEARFNLTAETKTRTFSSVGIVALHGLRVTLRPHAVSVVVTCPPKRADELNADVVVPKIDLDALGPDFAKKGPEEAELKLEVPGCSEVTLSPKVVVVTR